MNYTALTRTISGITNGTIDASYVGNPMSFVIGGAFYFSVIESVVVGVPTSVVLVASGSLPSADGTVTTVTLINQSGHTYQDYLDEIASLIKDDAGKLTNDVNLILTKAVTDWGRDVPLKVAKKITGTGSNKYALSTLLSGLWSNGYSQILCIEYPYGLEPPSLLVDEDWQIYDDGTAQDGSNLQLWLIENNPSTSEFFVIAFTVEPYLQSGLQNFPDTNANFSQITTLAAAYACQRLATAYAQSTDASISADVVNYNDKAAKYTTLAKQYFNRYNILVYGQEEPKSSIKAAMSQKELTPTTNQDNMSSLTGGVISSSYLFHRVRR